MAHSSHDCPGKHVKRDYPPKLFLLSSDRIISRHRIYVSTNGPTGRTEFCEPAGYPTRIASRGVSLTSSEPRPVRTSHPVARTAIAVFANGVSQRRRVSRRVGSDRQGRPRERFDRTSGLKRREERSAVGVATRPAVRPGDGAAVRAGSLSVRDRRYRWRRRAGHGRPRPPVGLADARPRPC